MNTFKPDIRQFAVTTAAGAALMFFSGLWNLSSRVERLEERFGRFETHSSANFQRLDQAVQRMDSELRVLSRDVAEMKGRSDARLSEAVVAPR